VEPGAGASQSLRHKSIWTRKIPLFVRILKSPVYASFIIFIIASNTIALALVGTSFPSDMPAVLDKLNLAFTIVFMAEMVLKMGGLGIKRCARCMCRRSPR
jgi:hypothetical protein